MFINLFSVINRLPILQHHQ